jgi:hypothetical protein
MLAFRTYVGQVERGEKNISVDSMERLAIAGQVPQAELLRWLESFIQVCALVPVVLDGSSALASESFGDLLPRLVR